MASMSAVQLYETRFLLPVDPFSFQCSVVMCLVVPQLASLDENNSKNPPTLVTLYPRT